MTSHQFVVVVVGVVVVGVAVVVVLVDLLQSIQTLK